MTDTTLPPKPLPPEPEPGPGPKPRPVAEVTAVLAGAPTPLYSSGKK